MLYLYRTLFPLANQIPILRTIWHHTRFDQPRTFTVIAGFTSSDTIFPIGLAAQAARNYMIDSKIVVIKRFVTVSTSKQISKIQIASADLDFTFVVEVVVGHRHSWIVYGQSATMSHMIFVAF